MKERRQQASEERAVHMQLPLRCDVSAGDLVTDHSAAVVGQQFFNQTVLDTVGFGWGFRAHGFGKL